MADSSIRLDRRLKGGLYARAGLPDYWIVNLAERLLEVYRDPRPAPEALHGWAYAPVAMLRAPATVAPMARPDRPVPVADLLP